VENRDGSALRQEQKYLPQRLVARDSCGEEVSIIALIKTQGSDTKLVGQMQPCYEALGLDRLLLAGVSVPPLVTQIADGENGGVMMNEFPAAFVQAHQRLAREGAGGRGTVAINGTEYLELLAAAGLAEEDFAPIQAVGQHRLRQEAGEATGAASVAAAIARLQAADPRFSMAGASWTNHLSWVEGYADVLEPMQQLSVRFHQHFDPLVAADAAVTRSQAYQEALLPLLLLETSCFRYWGVGVWTDYAQEILRRGEAALQGLTLPVPSPRVAADG
jgi:hypothetical protein